MNENIPTESPVTSSQSPAGQSDSLSKVAMLFASGTVALVVEAYLSSGPDTSAVRTIINFAISFGIIVFAALAITGIEQLVKKKERRGNYLGASMKFYVIICLFYLLNSVFN